jgi:hypothetical protein
MKRPVRNPTTGTYTIKDVEYKELFGSREQVWNGTSYKTTGGLTKDQLIMNKWGRIVSLSKNTTAKKENRLAQHGYFANKGKFGYVKRGTRKSKSKSKSKTPEPESKLPDENKTLEQNIEKESIVETKPVDETGVIERLFKSVPETAAKPPSKKAKSV